MSRTISIVLPCSTMQRIGIRDLRQHASRWLREVQRGESYEITDRGRVVARLIPAREESIADTLTASGRLSPADGSARDLPPPLAPVPDIPLPSEELEQLRAGER